MVQTDFSDRFTESIHDLFIGFVDFLPTLVGVGLLAWLGLFLGRKIGPMVRNAGGRVGLDEIVRETPFGALFPSGSDGVSKTFGALTRYFVVLLGIVLALEWFAQRTSGSTTWQAIGWVEEFVVFVPPIVIGLIVLFVGFFLANWATEQVRDSPAADRVGDPAVLAGGTKAFLYFVVLVVGLDTMGVDVTILHTFTQAFAFAAGIAVALAVGIAFGWGGKDFVAENIDDWFDRSSDVARETTAPSDDD